MDDNDAITRKLHEERAILAAAADAADQGRWRIAAQIYGTLKVEALVAAVEAALKDHRKSMFPAGPPGAGNAYGKHYCAGICYTAVDHQVIYRVWPCQPYQDITAALAGTGKEGSEDG